jgi:hypothetical protein
MTLAPKVARADQSGFVPASTPSPARRRRVLALLAAGLLGLFGIGTLAAAMTAAQAPVEATFVCVTGDKGQLSYPVGGTCPPGTTVLAVDDPAQIHALADARPKILTFLTDAR